MLKFIRLASITALGLLALAMPASAASVVLSTDVLNGGNVAGAHFGDGYNNNGTASTVELVRHIPLSTADPLNVTYTQGGATINFADYVTGGAEAGDLGSNIHGRGADLYLPGDGEAVGNNNGGIGIGAHANWLVTFDLNDIRTANLASSTQSLLLSGRFGMNGSGNGNGEIVAGGNFVQGLIYLDGTQILESALKQRSDPSQAISLTIPSTGHFLTFAIVNGKNSDTNFDDGSFRDLTLTTVPEPASLSLLGLGAIAVLARRRRNA